MPSIPDRHQQIRLVHAELIRKAVETCRNPERRQEFDTLLQTAQRSGWTALALALRRIAAGEQGRGVFAGLDEEDQVIADSVLRGLKDPSTLPDPSDKPDPTLAAPGLAHMIHTARANPQALALLGNMAEQMSTAGGSMARLAAVMRPLINGERDPERLTRDMDARTTQLVHDILAELGRLEAH